MDGFSRKWKTWVAVCNISVLIKFIKHHFSRLTTIVYFSSMKHLFIAFAIIYTSASFAQPAWQQRVDTRIDVTLDDNNHMLRAYEEITYTNNSPDTLRYIYIHLWPNAYKHDHTPYERQQQTNRSKTFYYSKAADKGYIDSLQFNVDGIAADNYSSDNAPDITRIDLPNPLLPSKTIKITTPFKVKIPKVFSRLGHTKQSYYISQWFPKPAVYDQYGWHPISYLDQGEFYSEYGSYKVSITLPANYVVMATGNCTDDKENKWMDELAAKPMVKLYPKGKKYPNTGMMGDTAYVYDKKTKIDSIPASSAEMKTLHFEEDNIHDFAWFADKRWIVRKDTVVSPGNNQLVTAWAAFMPSNIKYWSKATDHLKETVKHYGKWVGPYQYKTIKAVSGDLRAGGGMEYPTVTIIDKYQRSGLRLVVIHEAGHNWFYGMLGSNERDHAWMDEGLNTFYEQKTSNALDTGKKKKSGLDESLVYFQRAATGGDQAIEQTSTKFEKLNYGLDVYFKTAYSLGWLEAYMGKEDFEAGMHDYFDTWHFHHPYPEDFKKCMQRHTSKSIDWFFDPMLTSDKKVDFKITGAKIKDGHTEVTVKNKTGLNTPVQVGVYEKDSLIESAWSQPFERTTTLTLANTDWKRLKIGDVIPDAKTTNDLYRRGSPFHTFGLKIKPFVGLNRENKDQLFVSPSVGYNQYDGWMAGGLLHNLTLPENRFKFVVAPMYAFQTQSFVGAGSIGYIWYSKGLFKDIMLQTDAKTFHYNEMYRAGDSSHLFARYTKIAPSITFTFNEHNMLSPVTNTLTLKGYYIDEEYFDTTTFATAYTPSFSPGYPIIRNRQNNYGSITFSHHNGRLYNPFGYSLNGQMGADFAKVSVNAYARLDYNKAGKYLLVKGYFGKFFAINNTTEVINRYALTANYSAANDYLYDGTYIGRNAQRGIAAQQIGLHEGAFKVPTHGMVARSSNWMGTINMQSSMPFVRLPIYVFFDAGLIPNANPTFKNSRSTILLYDAGLALDIRVLGIGATMYVPIIMSSDFDNYLTNTYGRKNVFARSISFNINLWQNWLKAPSTLISVAGG
ncbi:MAG: hypothetical protein K0Q79_3710 [Flavipsychrobacter sp.]|nr:hypothetical protein [Flavipsychrobacter sp.]